MLFLRRLGCLVVALLIVTASFSQRGAQPLTAVRGLHARVEVLRDSFGINHIYATDEHDLFFAQGYCAAKDRLFQYEIWRRQATGTVAEILGPRELGRDIGARLFQFRGDMEKELAHYHQHGEEIITAFVDGVNAYIDEALQHPEHLPIEFKLLHILPGKWTPAIVISRHQGLLGNCTEELNYGMAVARAGSRKVKELAWFHPKDPILDMDTAINGSLLSAKVLEPYNAYRKELVFEASDIAAAGGAGGALAGGGGEAAGQGGVVAAGVAAGRMAGVRAGVAEIDEAPEPEGSNNWVVSGSRTSDGNAMLANDPHRRISVPSLRYMVHLNAPGWNVIGGGEPEIPGVSIGHNEYGAWGLTIFDTDGEDIYVYRLNPDNIHQYKYRGKWVDMTRITEKIPVKNGGEVVVDLYYTVHGPVTYIDSANATAYALRCAWMEPGGAPYLSSLRIDQATNWDEFRAGCNYANIPGENMVWADIKGNIGWQAVGIAPIRKNFSGLVPVPGDGRYEWAGFLPIKEKPHLLNPPKGFFATANQQVTPPEYGHWDAIGYTWSDDFRGNRINQVLSAKRDLTVDDFEKLQTDYFSIPASQLVPLLKQLKFESPVLEKAAQLLLSWDYVLDKNSIPAAIYIAWERNIKKSAAGKFIPPELTDLIYLSWQKTIGWILQPGASFGNNPIEERNKFLADCFAAGVDTLKKQLGDDMTAWKYGQEKYKHVYIVHPLGDIADEVLKQRLNAGPLPRGGNGNVPGSTGDLDNQVSGASFRMIMNTGNWDAAVGINTPGQSGDPGSEFYKNLFERWANDQYFPVYFSKDKIKTISRGVTLLGPAN